MTSSDKNNWNVLAKKAIFDEEAFVELYNHFFPLIYRKIMYLTRNADATDEIVSNVFLKMFENMTQFDETRGNVFQWLSGIAGNELKMYFRSEKSKAGEVSMQDYQDFIDEVESPEEIFSRQELNEQLWRSLERLNERERTILQLKYWLDFLNVEIAEIMGISANNVGVILNRALHKLKKYLATG